MEEWPLQRYQPSIPLYGEAIDLGRMLLESTLIGVKSRLLTLFSKGMDMEERTTPTSMQGSEVDFISPSLD